VLINVDLKTDKCPAVVKSSQSFTIGLDKEKDDIKVTEKPPSGLIGSQVFYKYKPQPPTIGAADPQQFCKEFCYALALFLSATIDKNPKEEEAYLSVLVKDEIQGAQDLYDLLWGKDEKRKKELEKILNLCCPDWEKWVEMKRKKQFHDLMVEMAGALGEEE
jgi:hypothetical protein